MSSTNTAPRRSLRSFDIFFLVVAFGELVLLLWRRQASDIAIAAMLVAAIVFTLSFFVISIACDYRYLYFLDVAAELALVYVCASAPDLWRIVTATRSGLRPLRPHSEASRPSDSG